MWVFFFLIYKQIKYFFILQNINKKGIEEMCPFFYYKINTFVKIKLLVYLNLINHTKKTKKKNHTSLSFIKNLTPTA